VVTAHYRGAAIAASVFCHFRRFAVFKYGASDMGFQEFRGSTLVMWKAIQWYIGQGCCQLSLGRTAAASSGLRRFKLGLGASETALGYVKYDFQRQEFVSGANNDLESGFRLATMLPLSINRLIGNVLYRHMA
jgi:lipid II:glycine glycyltransferase (peptidoglycan interpeptide bridge formation enzyme)